MSLDLSSLVSESGFRYRFGLHKNSGHPHALNATNGEAPLSLTPGLCAKAAFSYEKSRDFWRQKEKKEDLIEKTEEGWYMRPSYDVRLKEPRSAISGTIGIFCQDVSVCLVGNCYYWSYLIYDVDSGETFDLLGTMPYIFVSASSPFFWSP